VVISVVNFVVMLVRGYQAELEMRNSGFFLSEWSPYRGESLLLIIAALCLISTRLWILILSIVASGRVLYVLGYLRWRFLAHNAFELPMFTWSTVKKIWPVYLESPDEMFELILAVAVLICGFVMLRRFARERLYSAAGG
jgi:hypothetical protein